MTVKTVEAQTGNGNGCGEDFVDPVEQIFCNFGAALTKMTGKVGGEALANVSGVVKTPIPPEQALAFSKAVTAREVMDTFWDELNRGPQSPLTPELLVAVSGARSGTLHLLDSYYSAEGNGGKFSLLAGAIRQQIRQGR